MRLALWARTRHEGFGLVSAQIGKREGVQLESPIIFQNKIKVDMK